MPARFKDDTERDAFLVEPRLAILMTNRPDTSPMGVPVWFEWDGSVVRMFAAKGSAKLRRIEKDPRVSILVTNHMGEQEAWVAFDGVVEVHEDGATEVVARMGPRYWDLSDPKLRAMLDLWVQSEDAMVLMTLKPNKIRSGA
jgi:PPOX class probable F420-dependent enzyme